MSSAKITLMGLAQYCNAKHESLFDLMELPEGIDKELAIDTILMKGAEFEVLYASADWMKMAIGVWSKKWSRTFTKWYEALNISYNPLENYDRYEESEDSRTSSNDASGKSDNATISRNDDVSVNKISAFDSPTFENDSETSMDSTGNTDSKSSFQNFGTESSQDTHSARLHGNIGVTTSQMMLASELDIARWNLYEQIADVFLSEFIIPIY